MHLRTIELRNDTDRELVLTIEPTADHHLEAPTTFTGRFEPGERKTLYLYHGFRYQVDVLEPAGRVAVRLGKSTLMVADSLWPSAGLP